MKISTLVFGLVTVAPVCKAAPLPKFPDGKHPSSHKIVIQEVIQTTSYTYLHAKENDSLKWLAVPKMQANNGETYYYSEGLPMKQFESKELHRTFDEVLFLGGVSQEPLNGDKPKASAENPHAANGQPYTRKATPETKKDIKIDIPKDCISISELFAKKEAYAGKTIKVKGQVTKYSGEIMNKNWIHIQDGSENNGKFDLTITSTNSTKVGDIVTFEGKVAINKDFGYGYSFEVMLEEAQIK